MSDLHAENETLVPLVRALARVAACADHAAGIRLDMSDPDVARESLLHTFNAAFPSGIDAQERRST